MEYKHLEISARVSGKTERLIQAFLSDLQRDYKKSNNSPKSYQLIFPTKTMKTDFLNQLDSWAKVEKFLTDNRFKFKIFSETSILFRGFQDFRLYLDEFDYCSWDLFSADGLIQTLDVNRVKSFFASTTPEYKRHINEVENPQPDDVLLRLFNRCGGYKRYFSRDSNIYDNPNIPDCHRTGEFLTLD